jgi:hypothetical protein
MTEAYVTYLRESSEAAILAGLAYSNERGLGMTRESILADAASTLADAANAEAAKLRGNTL